VIARVNRRTASKKPRLSALQLSDEEEDEATKEASQSFSKRLTHFKKSPAKSGIFTSTSHFTGSSTVLKGRKSRSAASDDDDFIAPSDSDVETKSQKSTKSASSRSGSSRRSVISDDDDASEDDEPLKKSKSKSSAKKPAADKAAAPAATSGNSSFLTAAERRQLEKKNEKKESESPYSFLQDIKDVLVHLTPPCKLLTHLTLQKDGNRPNEPGYDPRTLYVPPKAWKDFTPFEKQACVLFLCGSPSHRFAIVLGDQAKPLRYGLSSTLSFPSFLT
jgi:DNA mismatch repair protein MSH6